MKQLLFLSVLVLMACKSDPNPVEAITLNQEKSYTITAEDVEGLKYNDYVLSPKSKDAISKWQKFVDLQTNIEFLRDGDLSFFKVELPIMEEFIIELKREQPSGLIAPAIRSRVTVLETNLLRLQNLANLDNIKKKDLLLAIKELLIANANLRLQMNKKFEKEAQQIKLPGN